MTVGPDLGPPVNGECTDVITTLAVDGAAEERQRHVDCRQRPVARRLRTTARQHLDNPDANGDNLRAGDLLMLRKGSDAAC